MFKVELYSPRGYYKTLDATLLNVVTNDGQRGILSNHMPLVSPLVISRLEIVNDNSKDYYAISNGVLYFKDNVARIVVEAIEHKNEIDIKRAEAARDRAINYIESKDSDIDVKRAEVALKRALNRIDVYHLK